MKLAALLAVASVPLLVAATGSKKASTKTGNIRTKDVTGSYEAKGRDPNDEFTLEVVQGDKDVSVEFLGAFGITAQTCDCLMTGMPAGDDAWQLAGTSSKAKLSVVGEKLVIEFDRPADCCGASFQGAPTFKLGERKAPQNCTVKQAKALFVNPDNLKTPTKKYVVKGDKVEAFSEGSEEPSDLILARYAGKKHTAGFIKAEDLSCPVAAPTAAPAASPVEPEPATSPDAPQ